MQTAELNYKPGSIYWHQEVACLNPHEDKWKLRAYQPIQYIGQTGWQF